MSGRDELAGGVNSLTPDELQYVLKLVCLMRFCPGFNKELKQIIPIVGGAVSPGQLAAIDDLMNAWLRKEEWAEILRPELERAGVKI